MKIVKLIGGLGNQMFQYAFHEELKRRHPGEKILLDLSMFQSYTLHKLEVLDVFSLKPDIASPEDISRLTRRFRSYFLQRVARKLLPPKKTEIVEPADDRFKEEYLEQPGDVYYEGYWQNYRYFEPCKERIRQIFTFPDFDGRDTRNREAAAKIREGHSVGIHVRRGNYLKQKMYCGICDETYYRRAVQYISERVESPRFYLFSNDVDWCRAFFGSFLPEEQLCFIDWNSGSASFRDMQLMSLCKHLILANSSFSWWGAYLTDPSDPERLILAPARWLNGIQAKEIHCPSWIKL